MSQTLCHWGILCTANIARKYWQAIYRAGNSALVAVASRDRARARRFIEECQAAIPLQPAPSACGSYAELLERDDIDAVYLPLPTGTSSARRRQLKQLCGRVKGLLAAASLIHLGG